ncbi:DUF6522 family protein [Bradyrhizobium monzae]|uniref:DUF6522 family protein n=1 Tax=Bradyrhizobium sp. Oc8 TaxID=2876780 RepID=UPI001F337285|nr:DUF6522 family protein [Bradyrhizobium sp. Oc8]
MAESREETRSQPLSEGAIEFRDDTFVVDAAIIGELLHLPASRVQILMRSGKITSVCERGVDEHAGEFRLSFFYRNRRARLSTDRKGRILRRSAIDFGDHPIPDAPRRPVTQDEDPVDPSPAAGESR